MAHDQELRSEQPREGSEGSAIENAPESPYEPRGRKRAACHHRGDTEPGALEEVSCSPPVEEAQMRPVHEAAVGVPESAEQELQALPPMQDVRQRDNDVTSRGDVAGERSQKRTGIRYVLEHVAANDEVEGLHVRVEETLNPAL